MCTMRTLFLILDLNVFIYGCFVALNNELILSFRSNCVSLSAENVIDEARRRGFLVYLI